MAIIFGFEQLDELAFAAAVGSSFLGPTRQLVARNLGTIVELQWLLQTGIAVPKLGELARTRRVELVREIASGRRTATFRGDAARSQIIKCFWERDEDPDDWHDFCESMQKAALLSGLPLKNAQELVAATRELVSNVFDHSGAPATGIAGFSTTASGLEIVVADYGIGVLDSLRTSPEFSSLRDAGEALQTALADGASRFGSLSGHGRGFRDLFRGLRSLSSALRFRSGDYALLINGISPRGGPNS